MGRTATNQPIMESVAGTKTLTREEIVIGRLRKRIAKLIEQRDHWKEQYNDFASFLKIYPYIHDHRNDYEKRREETKRLKELEATQGILVKELERLKQGK